MASRYGCVQKKNILLDYEGTGWGRGGTKNQNPSSHIGLFISRSPWLLRIYKSVCQSVGVKIHYNVAPLRNVATCVRPFNCLRITSKHRERQTLLPSLVGKVTEISCMCNCWKPFWGDQWSFFAIILVTGQWGDMELKLLEAHSTSFAPASSSLIT